MSLVTIQTVLGADVPNAGTFTVAYPAGRTGGDFQGGVDHQLIASGKLFHCPVDFGVAFGEFSATITWKGANPLKAGNAVRVQFDLPGEALENFVRGDGSAPVPITRAERAFGVRIDLGVPAAASTSALRAAAAVAGAGAMALIAAALTLDVPRNVQITSSGVDTTRVFTIVGKDEYGVALTETITGVNTATVQGNKAFKSVTSISVDAACAGNISCGFGNKLGLPVFLPATGLILAELQDGGAAVAGTKVAGLSALTASTAATADVRGTYVPNAAPDGAKAYSLFVLLSYRTWLGNPQA